MELRGRSRHPSPDRRPTTPRSSRRSSPSRRSRAWWGDFDLERVKADLLGGDADEDPFVIEHDGAVVGYIQAVEENEPDFRHAGIDLFLRTDLTRVAASAPTRSGPSPRTSSTTAATTG